MIYYVKYIPKHPRRDKNIGNKPMLTLRVVPPILRDTLLYFGHSNEPRNMDDNILVSFLQHRGF